MIQRTKILQGGRLIDLDAGALRSVDIVINGDSIVDVVERGAGPADAEIIDVSERILHAGLINGHTHGHGALARGMGDSWTLELLLAAAPWIYGNQSLEDMQLCAALNGVEMIMKGCTACYDLYVEFPLPSVEGMQAVANGYKQVGMRAIVAPMVSDTPFYLAVPGLAEALPDGLRRDVESWTAQPASLLLSRLRAIYSGWRDDRSSIGFAVAPTIPLHCTDDFFRNCLQLAAEHGAGVHSHISESKVQAIASLDRFGGTIVSHLSKLGALTARFTAAHAVWLTPDDMKLMADAGAHVAHNPASNMRLGNGLADVRTMLDTSLNVGIGTDGSSCSDNQNMYEAMRLASFVSKAQSPEIEDWCSTLEVARAATIGSAQLIGMGSQLGRVVPGFKADIVFLDANHPNWIPINDAVNQLVHCEDGSGVADVMIGGKFVVRDRRPVGVDLQDLSRKVERVRQRLEALNASTKQLSLEFSKVVGKFCPGLARRPFPVNRYVRHACDCAEPQIIRCS
jgi:5-methylthioadenosine/S-adenosylhomocysteine deaminase